MSEHKPATVEWKLNALLLADRQARAYARKNLPATSGTAGFTPWHPRQIALLAHHAAADAAAAAPATQSQPAPSAEAAPDEAVVTAPAASELALQEELAHLRRELEATAQRRFEEGHLLGKQETMQAFQARQQQLDELLAGLRDLRIDMDDFVAYLHALALALARAVLRHAVEQDASWYESIVREGLEVLDPGGQQPVILHVHPDVVPLLEAGLGTIGQALTLAPDARLAPGDLRLVCGHAEVEENLEDKLLLAFRSLALQQAETG